MGGRISRRPSQSRTRSTLLSLARSPRQSRLRPASSQLPSRTTMAGRISRRPSQSRRGAAAEPGEEPAAESPETSEQPAAESNDDGSEDQPAAESEQDAEHAAEPSEEPAAESPETGEQPAPSRTTMAGRISRRPSQSRTRSTLLSLARSPRQSRLTQPRKVAQPSPPTTMAGRNEPEAGSDPPAPRSRTRPRHRSRVV